MKTIAAFALVSALIAPRAGAQDTTASAAVKIDIDRIVAVVGTTPILWSEVLEQVNIRRARGMQVPPIPPSS